MSPIVLVDQVYKSYKATNQFEINRMFQWMAHRLKQASVPHNTTGRQYVLKNVNFTLNERESLGLIGNNGAGKTTLFRLLSGITLPTQGRIRVVGRVSSLIALGAGFHPELTGRENLYLNCALFGLSRKQTAARIDQIVDFAELDENIDVPIKHYSSGMLARLGFSVAVHLDPELILIDEVLSVGDYRFQVKSMAALNEFIERGTVILVSHDLSTIERICRRVIWLDRGEVKMDGPAADVIATYVNAQKDLPPTGPLLEETHSEAEAGTRISRYVLDKTVRVQSVEIQDINGQPCQEFYLHDTVVVDCHLTFSAPMTNVRVMIGLVDMMTQTIITICDNQLSDQPDELYGNVHLEARFPDILLRPRPFGIYVEVSNRRAEMQLSLYKDLEPRFNVIGKARDPQVHYFAPQPDITFMPGVAMRFVSVDTRVSESS